MRLRLVMLVLAAGLGCSQPEGGRCQTDDDCDPPLVCSVGDQRVCRASGTIITADAAPAIDSRFDARLWDANLSPIFPDAAAPDAVEPPDAVIEAPDAAVELPDAAEELPDASIEEPDAS